MKKSIVLSLLLLIILSCSKKTASTTSTKPAPQAVDPVATTAASIDMTVAESQFRQTCGSCHTLPDPQKHTAAEWPITVNKMQQKKNGFDNATKEQILAFLTANARQ